MTWKAPSSPHIHSGITVTKVMMRVLYALIPAWLLYVLIMGPGIVITTAIAVFTALAAEAIMLLIRRRPLKPALTDGSAIVTAVLLAMTIPSTAPWWITCVGVVFAIVIVKQLYGGLGYNPFNPAMAGYVMLLISFPREMTQWVAPHGLLIEGYGLTDIVSSIFNETMNDGRALDAITMATPLDLMKTQLGLEQNVSTIMASNNVYGFFAGYGWEWINVAILGGGLWLLRKRIISWHIPVAMIGTIFLFSSICYLIDSDQFASPWFHIFSGGTILGAFFIATDPVTAATSQKGKLIYGAGIGLLTCIIRYWGGYPDGVAFAVLLMNIVAPTIDYYTQPRVYGHKQ